MRSQIAQHLVQFLFDRLQSVFTGRRTTKLAVDVEQIVRRDQLRPVEEGFTQSVLVIERARLCKIETRDGVAHFSWIFLSFGLRNVYGNHTQSFAFSLIAQ